VTVHICYVMHPYGNIPENLEHAAQWCAFLTSRFDALFVAPWAPLCKYWVNNGVSLDRGLRLDCEFIGRCDSCIAVGGRWSPGMLHERSNADKSGVTVYDATQFRTPNSLLADQDAMRAIAKVYGWAP
jgi:hypothetical protein